MATKNTQHEGVIKYSLSHQQLAPSGAFAWRELEHWRHVLWRLGLTGQDQNRYGGYAFGNVSCRLTSGFLVSGSQTGGNRHLDLRDYVEITGYDLRQNRIESRGLARPSSESLSHAAVYEAAANAGCVLHVHNPSMWHNGGRLGWYVTPPHIEYGTQEMADTLRSWCTGRRSGIVVMRGHEDGVIVFSKTISSAGCILLQAWSAAVSEGL